jgi:hypothetical protein
MKMYETHEPAVVIQHLIKTDLIDSNNSGVAAVQVSH